MTTPVLLPVIYDAPLLNPSPHGLYAAAVWTDETGPTRFLADGVQIRPWNYGGEDAFGVWNAPWCGEPGSDDEVKDGVRPDMDPEPFYPVTVWAYDECDLTAPSRDEVVARVQQILRLEEQTAVEQSFAGRLLDDATTIETRETYYEAVAYLEGELAKTNTTGMVHVSAGTASLLGGDLVFPIAGGFRTLLGHRYVFGGGYVDGLDDVLVATSQVYGWRDTVQVRMDIKSESNVFAAVAERSVVLGYEKLVAAVQVTVGS